MAKYQWIFGVRLLYIALTRHSFQSNAHLGKSRDEAERIAYESFCQNGCSFLEIVLTKKFGLDSPQLRFDPPELFDALKNCQRPIVAATAHFGSWELLASLLGQIYEAPRPRMVVVRSYPDPAVQSFIASCRSSFTETGTSSLPVISLRKGALVAMRYPR